MLVANEILIDDYSLGSVNSYTTSSILTGSLIRMYRDLSGSNYLSPLEYKYARPFEQTARSIDTRNMTAVKYDDNVDYIFATDSVTAANTLTRRIVLFAFDKSANEWVDSGYVGISCSFDVGAAFKTRNLGAVAGVFYRYTSGSVEVNGLGVTGSSTNWATNRIFQGSRIGFGTTNYSDVPQWYEIADVPTETNLNITQTSLPLPSYPPGTPYVIEELKLVTTVRHSTASFNGMLVVNGLNRNVFNNLETTIKQYSSSADDRTQGYYLIRDGHPTGSVQNSTFAVAIDPVRVSPTEHYAYMCEYRANPQQFKYYKCNIAAPVSSFNFFAGAVSESFTLATDRVTIAGGTTITTGPSMDIVKTGHGPGSGSYSIYHYIQNSNPSRLIRIPLTDTVMYSGSLSFLNDSMTEIVAGGTDTRGSVGTYYVAYVPSIDKFVSTSPAAAGTGRILLTKYNNGVSTYSRYGATTLGMLNRFGSWIGDEYQPKHAITSADLTMTVAATDDILYVQAGATNATFTLSANTLFAVPIACDWETAPRTKQWVTFPPIDTSNALSYSNVYTKSPSFLGSDTLGFVPERLVIYYRTSGIADDTGEWSIVPTNGDLSGITVSSQIQFSVAFDVLGAMGLYNRLQGLCFTYNDNRQDDHYQASLDESVIANNQIVWIQVKKWNSNIPNLKVNIFNTLNNTLLIDDTTAVQTQGTFEYSEDGGVTYLPWDATKDAIGNRIRYTATTLPANTNIKIILNRK